MGERRRRRYLVMMSLRYIPLERFFCLTGMIWLDLVWFGLVWAGFDWIWIFGLFLGVLVCIGLFSVFVWSVEGFFSVV